MHQTKSRAFISVFNCVVFSALLTLLFGPSELIIYNDAVFKTPYNEAYLIGYQQPSYGANSITSQLVLVEPQSFNVIQPTANQAVEIDKRYPYKPSSSFASRHIFIISLSVSLMLLTVFSPKKNYYLSPSPDVQSLREKLDSLRSSLLDCIRFFWIIPILKRRIKANTERKKLLFNLLKESFDEQATLSDYEHNLFFNLIDDALLNKRSVIRIRLNFDLSKKIKVRQISKFESDYVHVNRNPNALYMLLKSQLKQTPYQNNIEVNRVLDHHVAAISDLFTRNKMLERNLINSLNGLVDIFNLTGVVGFELASGKVKPHCIITVNSIVSERSIDSKPYINHSSEKAGGIFTFQPRDFDSPIAYIRPVYQFSVQTKSLNVQYTIPHKYDINCYLNPGANYKQELSEVILPLDMNFALSEFLISALRITTVNGLSLEQFDPQILKERDRQRGIRDDVRNRMEELTSNSRGSGYSKAELSSRYRVSAKAYCSSILSNNASTVRTEIYYSTLNNFNAQHNIFKAGV